MKPISAILGSPKETITEKFAWWPIRSTWSKKIIWFKKYVQMDCYYDGEFNHPIRSNSWTYIYTENEYLLMLLRKENQVEV